MNYLFHLFVAEPTEAGWLGALLGDFVKGRLDDRYPAAIRRGIEQHRRLDRFAHDHAVIRASVQRLDPAYRHYRPILVDIFYDHFLAKNWGRYSPLTLHDFAQRVYRTLTAHHSTLPAGLQRIAPVMIAHNWLESYRDLDTVPVVLERLARRLSRPNALHEGAVELLRHYGELEEDFRAFLPLALAHSRAF